MSKWRCTKCGREFTDEELEERWERGLGPKEVERDNPVGAVVGGTLGAVIGSVLGPLGVIAGALMGAALFGKERKRNPNKGNCSEC